MVENVITSSIIKTKRSKGNFNKKKGKKPDRRERQDKGRSTMKGRTFADLQK